MAILPGVFNVQDNKGSDFTAIPAGWYNVIMTKSELKDTKSGGKMLACQFKVLDGEYQNRMVFTNFNLVNANPVAVEIARRSFAELCEACGFEEIEETNDLLDIELQVRLKIREATANYPESNDITAFKAAE